MFAEIRAVYFDLDDTLCGYWDACKAGLRATFEEIPVPGASTTESVAAWAEAFRAFCPRLRELEFYERYLLQGGVTRVELMRRTLSLLGVEDEELATALSAAYLRHRHLQLKLFPDASHLLQGLHARYPLGLITNGPADIQREEIEVLGIGQWFSHFFIEGELGFGKPDPEVFRRAAAAVNLEPSQLLFVGNSYHHDVRPAIEAGWKTAWIRRPSDVPPSAVGETPKPESRPDGAPQPTLEITTLGALESLLLSPEHGPSIL